MHQLNSVLEKKKDQFDSIWKHLHLWIKYFPCLTDKPNASNILLFVCTEEWFEYFFLIAILLATRGHSVDYCYARNDIGKHSRRKSFTFHIKQIYFKIAPIHLLERINLIDINQHAAKSTNACSKLHKKISYSQAVEIDLSYILRKDNSQINKRSKKNRRLLLNQYIRNLKSVSLLDSITENRPYSCVVMPSGVVLEYGASFRLLTSKGLKISTIETWEKPDQIVASYPSNQPIGYITVRINYVLKQKPLPSPSELALLRQTIISRRAMSSMVSFFGVNFRDHKVNPKLATFTSDTNLLENNFDSPYCLLLPNVPFDANFYIPQNQNLFVSFKDWAVKTLLFLAENSINTVIRVHPAENIWLKETKSSGFIDIISEIFDEIPQNFQVISSQSRLSTYSLFENASCGVTYASSTVVEMAMTGLPVITGYPGQHYSNRGFTIESSSQNEFFNSIIFFTSSRKRLNAEQIDIATNYADAYFNLYPQKLPIGAPSTFLKKCSGSNLKRILESNHSKIINDFINQITAFVD